MTRFANQRDTSRLPLRARPRQAFTLSEMLLSMSILSILVTVIGLATTVLLHEGANNRNMMAASSIGAASAVAQSAAARDAVDQIDSDLKVATAISPQTLPAGGMQLTLVVPPRYAGDSSETIIYQWAGPGSPLTRQLNANAPATIAQNVQNWTLTTAGR